MRDKRYGDGEGGKREGIEEGKEKGKKKKENEAEQGRIQDNPCRGQLGRGSNDLRRGTLKY